MGGGVVTAPAARDGPSTRPRPLGPGSDSDSAVAKRKSAGPTERDADSVSTSSSDFDIVVEHDAGSIVTELTQDFEGSAVLDSSGRVSELSAEAAAMAASMHAAAAFRVEAGAAEVYSSYRAGRGPSRPPRLPTRMPLYNKDDGLSASPVTPTRSQQTSGGTRSPDGSGGRHPSVEKFLAEAMEQAKMSMSPDAGLTTEEEEEQGRRQRRHTSSGVSSGSSGGGRRGRKGRGEGRGGKEKKKKSRSGSGGGAGGRPSSGGRGKGAGGAVLSQSSPDLVQTETRTHAGKLPDNRRESMQSFFSDEEGGPLTMSTQGEDYVC